MKNKINYIFLFLLLFFSFVNNNFAEELEFSISTHVVGDKTKVVAGEEVTINLAVNSEKNIKTCTFEITNDSGAESVSNNGMNNYVVNTDSNKIIVSRADTETEFVSGQNVLELKYKINSNSSIKIKTLNCSSSDENINGSYNDIDLKFEVEETKNTSLSDIVVNGGVISPKFSSSIKSYNIKLDTTEFSLKLTASDSQFQDKIVVKDSNGKKLDVNKITFSDESGQATMKLIIYVDDLEEYTLFAKYEQKELDNSLKSLIIDGNEIELETDVYEYTINVKKNVNSVKIEATLTDEKNFKFSDNNGPTNFKVPNSSNTYPLIIEPINSSVGAEGITYIININKEGNTSSTNPSSSSKPQNTGSNPSTGGVSMVLMIFILFTSLISSIIIYQKRIS